jgi:outer membrane protein OmpU
MEREKHLLRTSAALTASMLITVDAAAPAIAAEVLPGGYPDLTITGFARFLAHGGQLDDARQENEFSRSLDFSNDTEVHVLARGKDEKSGTEYGATIEFEADTNRTDNTDETWVFLRGGWGEVRLGDEDGVADNSAVGAQTIAAGTGGIDGTVVDTIATSPVYLDNTNDATKIRYYTPSFGGFSVGVSYTPQQFRINSGANNGDNLALKNVQAQNVVEGGLVYKGAFSGAGILAAIVGLHGDIKGNDNQNAVGGDDWWGCQAGASVDLFGLNLAGSYGQQSIGNQDKKLFTAGIGYVFGSLNTSITYGKVLDIDRSTGLDKPSNLVVSADIALMPGMVLAGDVGFFNNDVRSGTDFGTGDDGWQTVGRLGVAF